MSGVKNYKKQGCDTWVIEGTLEVTDDGQIILNGTQLKRAENQEDSAATTIAGLKDDFNELLARLRAAGLMADK